MVKEDIKKTPKILYLTFRFPYPPEKGGYNLRAFNLGKILAKYYNVDLITLCEKKPQLEEIEKLGEIFNQVKFFILPTFLSKIKVLFGLFSKKPLQVSYYWSNKLKWWLEENYQNYGLLFCSEIRTAEYVKNLKIKKCIDFVDAISLNYQQAIKYANFFWKLIYLIENRRLLKYEREIVDCFDLSFITAKKDKDFILKGENKRIVILPNGVKKELLNRKPNEGKENWLTFLGKMDYLPNEDACIFFSQKIFPKIKKELPGSTFYIIGINPTKKILNLQKVPGVKVTGFVKDPYYYLEKSKLIVAPLRFSGGSQNKILEAMALGKTVVTTPVGASGIPEAKNGEHFIVVNPENPDKMADKIIELTENENERKKIGNNAKKFILENYTWNKIGKILIDNIRKP